MARHRSDTTLRMIYPQWQGGDICSWLPELPRRQAARGYYLGAQLLDFLAPRHDGPTVRVKVSRRCRRRRAEDGVLDRKVLVRQTRHALKLLHRERPGRVLVLGGECSVSVAPFAYLRKLYGRDLVLIWIDAHPDLTLPGDAYTGYHAMAVSALMGRGDERLTGLLPAAFDARRILMVGLRDWERPEVQQRQLDYGIAHLGPEQVRSGLGELRRWLRESGAAHAAIHLDLDVLDPVDMVAGVGVVDNGLTLRETMRVIRRVARECEVVGMTVAEPMPRLAIRLQAMLRQLPLTH